MAEMINIIYPQDESTDFLVKIIEDLQQIASSHINLIRLENRNQHEVFWKEIQSMPDDELYMFLGHGGSESINGASTSDCNFGPLIEENQLQLFRNKKVVFLSCRSNEFLEDFGRNCGVKSGIGFPDMITDIYDVQSAYFNPVIKNIQLEDLVKFKKILVRLFTESIIAYSDNKLTLFGLYHRIKLMTAIELLTLVKKNESEVLIEMIRSIKDDLFIFGN